MVERVIAKELGADVQASRIRKIWLNNISPFLSTSQSLPESEDFTVDSSTRTAQTSPLCGGRGGSQNSRLSHMGTQSQTRSRNEGLPGPGTS